MRSADGAQSISRICSDMVDDSFRRCCDRDNRTGDAATTLGGATAPTPPSATAKNRFDRLGERVFGLIDCGCAAPTDMVVGPDEHGATLADLSHPGPDAVRIGIARPDPCHVDSDAELLGRDRRGVGPAVPFGADDQAEGAGAAVVEPGVWKAVPGPAGGRVNRPG